MRQINIINTTSIPMNALIIIKALLDRGYEAYLVGGCVRDLILSKTPHDYDICTNAKPSDTIEILKELQINHIPLGIEYGTVVAKVNNEEYEITTYRSDGEYTDSRHPDLVQFTTNISDDLSRRDFTINALAYNPYSKELIDIFGGKQDIEDRIIRAVGNPDQRFQEDALRILRALRFSIVYEFGIDHSTSTAMHTNKELLTNISKERITTELQKALTSNKPTKSQFMQFNDIIITIIPELQPCINFNQNNKYHQHDVYKHTLNVVDNCNTSSFEIKLAALLHDIGKPESYTEDNQGHGHFYGHPEVSHRITQEVLKNNLRLTTAQSARVLNLVKYHDVMIANTTKSIKRALNKHGVQFMKDYFILKQADIDDHINIPDNTYNLELTQQLMNKILEEKECFSLKDLNINGRDIMQELQVKPSEQIGIILNILLDEVMDNKISNNKVELLKRVQELGKSTQ